LIFPRAKLLTLVRKLKVKIGFYFRNKSSFNFNAKKKLLFCL